MITRDCLYRALKAVLPFVCADSTHPHLSAILFEDGAMIATDGHTLARVIVSEHLPDFLLPLTAAEDLCRRVKPRAAERGEEIKLRLKSGALHCGDFGTFAVSEERFPPWRKVVPEARPGVALDPRYLARVCAAAKVLQENHTRITYGNGVLDPVRFDLSCATFIVMPRRLK